MVFRFWQEKLGHFPDPMGTGELRPYDLLRGIATGTYAIGHADTTVAVTGESDAGQQLTQALHAVETIEVSDAVLRHGRFPFVDTGEERLGAQAANLWTQDLLQFVAHDADDLIVAERPDLFRIPSGKKATQQGAVFRSTVREF